jgi:hypothetical protein
MHAAEQATTAPRKRPAASRSATAAASGAKRRAAPQPEPAPKQGYECQGDTVSGSVQPPGGAELVASAVELVGELAKAGLSSGERLLKDFVTRLPLP